MRCDRAIAMLNQLVDGELGRLAAWRMRRHIARCQSCAWRLEEIGALRSAIRTTLPYHRASPALAARIGAALPREQAPAAPGIRRWRLPASGIGLSGIGFSGALAGVALTLLVQAGLSERADRSMGREAIAAHTAAMTAGHLIDIPTSDRHVVKPWLSARLDVSPPVADLTGEGFPLIGGRLDRIAGRKAAVVVYKRREHVIDLYAWNAGNAPDAPPRPEIRQGFNTISWRQGGIDLVAVSDVAAGELAEFVARIATGG
jgi:anti-sigma factor RsiW